MNEAMSKDAMQYVADLAVQADAQTRVIKTQEIDGRLYSEKTLTPVIEPMPDRLEVTSLKAVAEYLKENIDGIESRVLVHVRHPTTVKVLGPVQGKFLLRPELVYADCARILPNLLLNHFMRPDEFIIMLKSGFQNVCDRDDILQIVGGLNDKTEVTASDDGIAQQVTIKKGQTQMSSVNIKSEFTLAPYRTFPEIPAQPQTAFVLRVQDGPTIGLFEADGGAWRAEAMNLVQDWLELRLAELGVDYAKVIA